MKWVGFPGLGVERITLPDYILKIFGLTIGFYSIILCVAMLAGIFICWKLSEKIGILKSSFFDMVLTGLIFGFLGARIYYIVFNFSQYFQNDSLWQNLFELINFRAGGIAIYGGLIFSLCAGTVVCKFKNIKILPALDLASIGFSVGQSIGRWGNFFNIEAYGSKTNMPWGMISNKIPAYLQPVHPTFFYESVWCCLVFLILILMVKRRKFDGELFLIYLALYSFERFFVEGLRTDSLMLFQTNIRVSQALSLVFFVCSVVCLFVFGFKFSKNSKKLFVQTKEFKQMLKTKNS